MSLTSSTNHGVDNGGKTYFSVLQSDESFVIENVGCVPTGSTPNILTHYTTTIHTELLLPF
ncbi:MAG: hypothetical protein N2746_00605 [Deltaproteobacteria bacterium]|nr:hypothetical protein [Deltaproteobacteria bacterium]